MSSKRPRQHNDPNQSGRKRRKGGLVESTADDHNAPVVDVEAQQAAVQAYMHHAVKLLHKGLKKSRTFETQKLVRKIKQAKDPKDAKQALDAAAIADLDAQLEALKTLDIDSIPPYFLSTRLSKLPYLSSPATSASTLIEESLRSIVTPSKTELDPKTVQGKARNRVLANKAVKEAWDDIHRAVAKRMGQPVEDRPTTATPAKAAINGASSASGRANTALTGEKATTASESGAPVVEKRLSKRAERAKKAAEKALLPKPSMTIHPGRLAALEQAASDGDAEDEEHGRGLVAGSDDDDDLDPGSDVDDDDEIQAELARLGGAGDASDQSEGDWSGSELDADDNDDQDDDDNNEAAVASDSSFPIAGPSKSAAVTNKSTAAKSSTALQKDKNSKRGGEGSRGPSSSRQPVTSSAFLPSLAGGYISYSDSDGEDAQWVKDAEKGEKKERKNRRGQRARQAIWEKKYGSGANHIAKTTGAKPAVPKGGKAGKKASTAAAAAKEESFDPRHAPGGSANPNAVPVGERKLSRPTITYKSQQPIVPAAALKVAEAIPAPARTKIVKSKIEEGMHPSWEAKRRAQEALANLSAAPKGKKITFD